MFKVKAYQVILAAFVICYITWEMSSCTETIYREDVRYMDKAAIPSDHKRGG